MSRKTNQHDHFNESVWKEVNEENKLLLTDFKAYLQSVDRAESTIHQYTADLEGFFCWFKVNCKNKEFYDIKKKDVIRYQNYLLNELELSSGRIRRLRSSLSSLSNYIVKILDEDYPDFKNIINFIEAPQNKLVREKTVLSEEELKKICDGLVEIGKHQEACYFAILASSGIRKTEAFRLKVSDFSKDRLLNDAVYKSRSIKTKGRGKSGKMLHKFFLISILEPYLTLWIEERENNGIDNEYLFATKDGKLTPAAADHWCKLASDIINKDVYSHVFRHYLTSYMSKNNVPNKIIQEYFGWASLSMIQIYDDNEAEDSFGEYFSKDGINKVDNKNLKDI